MFNQRDTRGSRNPSELWGWVDADWASETRCTHTGYIRVLMMNGGPISWKSRRQDIVSLSTFKAEFVSASQAGQAILFLETLKYFFWDINNETQLK